MNSCNCACSYWKHAGICTGEGKNEVKFRGVIVKMCDPCAEDIKRMKNLKEGKS